MTGAVYNVLPNEYLSGVMHANLERVGGFAYTPEEAKFAEEIRKTLTDPPTSRSARRRRCGRCAPAPSAARRPISPT